MNVTSTIMLHLIASGYTIDLCVAHCVIYKGKLDILK